MSSQLQVTLRRSTIGSTDHQKRVVKGLGLRGIGSQVSVANTPSFRGMIKKVIHLVDVQEATSEGLEMADILSKLQAPEGAVRPKRRIGRGIGSGLGKTGGRGQKGQKARSGGNINKVHFQGGQTPLQRRLPKRGFRNPFPVAHAIVSVSELERFEAGSEIDLDSLRAARLIKGKVERVKILGGGELTKSLKVKAHQFSKSAKEKIEAAGGSLEVIPPRPHYVRGADDAKSELGEDPSRYGYRQLRQDRPGA